MSTTSANTTVETIVVPSHNLSETVVMVATGILAIFLIIKNPWLLLLVPLTIPFWRVRGVMLVWVIIGIREGNPVPVVVSGRTKGVWYG